MFLPDDVHFGYDQLVETIARERILVAGTAAVDSWPEQDQETDEISDTQEEELIMGAAASLEQIESVTLEDVRTQTASDPVMRTLHDTILTGFPESAVETPETIRIFHQYREHLSVMEDIVMYQDRIVIPPSLRDNILTMLHAAHQAVTSMNARARASVFWPGITAEIQQLRDQCMACHRIAPSNPKPPPTPSPDPTYPFEMICADYFKYAGNNYLIVVDRYSGWPTTYQLSGGAVPLVKKLRELFVTFNIPKEMSSDGGPEFTATETQKFLKEWGVSHRLSSVAYPHSNCRAEVGVKTAKRMIMENVGPNGEVDLPKFQRAMMQYRNTPSAPDNLSPAQIVFGRQVRDFIPVQPGKYEPYKTWKETAVNREEALRERHNREIEALSPHTKKLPQLKVGDTVWVQNQTGNSPKKWDRSGLIIEVRQNDQYAIKMHGSGRVTLRNRQFLRRYVPYVTRQPPRVITDDQPQRPARQILVPGTGAVKPRVGQNWSYILGDISTPLGQHSPPATSTPRPAASTPPRQRLPAASTPPRQRLPATPHTTFDVAPNDMVDTTPEQTREQTPPSQGPNAGPTSPPTPRRTTRRVGSASPPAQPVFQEETLVEPRGTPPGAFLPAMPSTRPKRTVKRPPRYEDYDMDMDG